MINDKLTKELQEQITENKDDIAGNNIYSTSETNTHKKWVNNKPIYRKVIITNNINSSINTGITDCEDIIKMEVLVKQTSTGDWRNIPWLFSNGETMGSAVWTGGFYFSKGVIMFQVGNSLKETNRCIVILEYTKTTD